MTSRPEPRTAEEKAQELKLELMDYLQRIPGADWKEIQEIIAAALREYGDEARAEGFEEGRTGFQGVPGSMKSYYAQGFSDCRERAAKMVEGWNKTMWSLDELVQCIRALTPSEGER